MEPVIEKFLELVQIDSPSGEEQPVAEYLINWLKKHGFSYKQDKVGNIFAGNSAEGEPLLLCAHMDTVSPGKGIRQVIKDGVIKSSGDTILGADNKASLACILGALEKQKSERPLELLFTVKEETGGGVENLPFEWIKSKKAVIFDSAKPLGGIVLRSPYIYNFNATIKGKAAHSSTPTHGKNAFVPMIKALGKIPVGEMDQGETTINVGLIGGGTGINTVPETVTISGEVRSYTKELFDSHLDQIEKILKEEAQEAGCEVKYVKDAYCAGYTHNKSSNLIQEIEKVYAALGMTPVHHLHSEISDANVLNEKGIETVNLTYGGEFPHTLHEQISIESLLSLEKIIAALSSAL